MKEQTLKAHKKYELRMANAIKHIMDSEHGRFFMLHLMDRSGVLKRVFDTNNSLQSMKAGKQDLGLWVLEEIKSVDEKYFIQLMTSKEIGD